MKNTEEQFIINALAQSTHSSYFEIAQDHTGTDFDGTCYSGSNSTALVLTVLAPVPTTLLLLMRVLALVLSVLSLALTVLAGVLTVLKLVLTILVIRLINGSATDISLVVWVLMAWYGY